MSSGVTKKRKSWCDERKVDAGIEESRKMLNYHIQFRDGGGVGEVEEHSIFMSEQYHIYYCSKK